MGLRTKEACGDQGLDWDQSPPPPGLAEPPKPPFMRRQPPPQQQQQHDPESLKCPRCGSNNTKFCYYNNYNKSQPRHFCKSCKRHWTKGGTLRNVPIGGGRKSKRPRNSTAATAAAATSTDRVILPIPDIDSDRKSMPGILYEAMARSSANTSSLHDTSKTGNGTTLPDAPMLNASCVSQNAKGECYANENATLMNHDSYQLGIDIMDHYPGINLDSMEEPDMVFTMNTMSMTTWPSLNMSGNMDLSNCWNWNEVDDIFVNSSSYNVAWDDVYTETKP